MAIYTNFSTKVRFIGADKSLGYRTGVIYDLDLVTDIFGSKPMILYPMRCPYSSWAKFWENWEPISYSKRINKVPKNGRR